MSIAVRPLGKGCHYAIIVGGKIGGEGEERLWSGIACITADVKRGEQDFARISEAESCEMVSLVGFQWCAEGKGLYFWEVVGAASQYAREDVTFRRYMVEAAESLVAECWITTGGK